MSNYSFDERIAHARRAPIEARVLNASRKIAYNAHNFSKDDLIVAFNLGRSDLTRCPLHNRELSSDPDSLNIAYCDFLKCSYSINTVNRIIQTACECDCIPRCHNRWYCSFKPHDLLKLLLRRYEEELVV